MPRLKIFVEDYGRSSRYAVRKKNKERPVKIIIAGDGEQVDRSLFSSDEGSVLDNTSEHR